MGVVVCGVFGVLSWRFVLFGVGCVSLFLVSETDNAPQDSTSGSAREGGTASGCGVCGGRKTVADGSTKMYGDGHHLRVVPCSQLWLGCGGMGEGCACVV